MFFKMVLNAEEFDILLIWMEGVRSSELWFFRDGDSGFSIVLFLSVPIMIDEIKTFIFIIFISLLFEL